MLRHRADGICALLDEHCPKLLLDSAFPRWPRSLEHRSLRQNHLAFALYACCCRHQQVMTSLWCEVALRRNRASLLRMRVRPVQASSAAAAAQQSRFRALRHWLPPCGHVHGGAGHYVGCRTAFGVPAQPLHLSAIVDSRLACCQPSAHEFSRCSKLYVFCLPHKACGAPTWPLLSWRQCGREPSACTAVWLVTAPRRWNLRVARRALSEVIA